MRMLVVKHLYNWSFPQTSQFVADSLVLRQFCRVYFATVPDQSILNRWARLREPATLHPLLDHIVDLACQLQVTHGRKLRIDGTVVETNIHHPTDSTLLNDGVRLLSRTLQNAKTLLRDMRDLAPDAYADGTQQAREKMKRIMEVARQKGDAAAERLKTTYRDLVELTSSVVARAKQVQAVLTVQSAAAAQRVAGIFNQFIPLVEQVITQTTRRVLQGEQVRASEKIVSLFEPETAIIRKGKPGKPTEFGRCVWLSEVEGAIISRYAVLAGNPDEKAQLPPSLDQHIAQFGQPPDLVTGDRGIHSAANERYARKVGVREVGLPKPGKKSAKRIASEQQDWFRAGRNWRAYLEGHISGLKRRHGLECCRYHGDDGMERWVGLGLIAHDLHQIAQHRPDVAVLDIGTAGLNGVELTAQVAVDYPDVRVFILSMHAHEAYVLQALRAGAVGYLLKDADTVILGLALKVVMRGEVYLSPAVSRQVVMGAAPDHRTGARRFPLVPTRMHAVAKLPNLE